MSNLPGTISIEHIGMSYNVANEQLNSLKEYFIKIARHELFFKEFVALNDINALINPGEKCGIVGTNGSGKSTLLKIIAGVLDPTRGKCEVTGAVAPLIELGAGFDMELTARENIYLNGAILGYDKRYINNHFDEIVEFAEVEKFIDMPLKNYSSGMVARIAFSIATATIPDILLVDEALSVGDFKFQKKCEEKIKNLCAEHGTTLLFVSHNVGQVERVCDRAIWIEKGIMKADGPAEDVCTQYREGV